MVPDGDECRLAEPARRQEPSESRRTLGPTRWYVLAAFASAAITLNEFHNYDPNEGFDFGITLAVPTLVLAVLALGFRILGMLRVAEEPTDRFAGRLAEVCLALSLAGMSIFALAFVLWLFGYH